jgi:hypothetical protein
VVELAVVQGDDRLAEGGGVAGVEGGVPLAVFVAEADDDDVCGADQRLSADRVDAGAHVVAPERRRLLPERPDPGVVGSGVIGDRRGQLDRQPGFAHAGLDPLPPVRVDLAREVDAPGPLGHSRNPSPRPARIRHRPHQEGVNVGCASARYSI